MTVIGITGPTGAGKTTALGVLEEMGFRVLDCDKIYHALLQSDLTLQQELKDRFGSALWGPDGLDRKALGRLVWEDAAALADLNEITHRHILAALRCALDRAAAEGLPGAAVDAVALIESGAGELCQATVAVTAPEETRVRRIMARDGIGEDYARARVRSQRPSEWYERHCQYTLVNDDGQEAFARRARQLFVRLTERS